MIEIVQILSPDCYDLLIPEASSVVAFVRFMPPNTAVPGRGRFFMLRARNRDCR